MTRPSDRDVYVGFTDNEVERTDVLHHEPTGLEFNVDIDSEGGVVGVEVIGANYIEVDGIKIEKDWKVANDD